MLAHVRKVLSFQLSHLSFTTLSPSIGLSPLLVTRISTNNFQLSFKRLLRNNSTIHIGGAQIPGVLNQLLAFLVLLILYLLLLNLVVLI